MKLKTFRASTMADVLTAVKRDLGRDAVILHTRTIRTGGWLGFGRRSVVEVTASDEVPAAPRRGGVAPAAAAGPSRGAAGAESPAPVRTEAARTPPAVDTVQISSAAGAMATTPAPVVVCDQPPRAQVATSPEAKVEGGASVPSLKAADETSTHMTVRERRPAPAAQATTVVDPARLLPAGSVHRELADIKLLVNQVLQSTSPTASCIGKVPEALFRHYLQLLESQVSRELADRIIGLVREDLAGAELANDARVRGAMLTHLAKMIPVCDGGDGLGAGRAGRPRVIALVGPTGVGKTTTVAKLAATFKLRQGRSVGLITSDTYRIAAVEQLRTYASIIGLPMKVAMTSQEMRAAVGAFSGYDVVLIDTAGRSQHNTDRLGELSEMLDAAEPDETHLVLSSTANQEVLYSAADAFAVTRPNRVILTKLDEAVHFGVVVNVMQRLNSRLSFVTTGQEVPDHIVPGRAERLAQLVLENRLVRPQATAQPGASPTAESEKVCV